MTEPNPAGVSIPLRPAATGGEDGRQAVLPADFSPSQRRDDALRSETNSGHSFDDYR